ncbi:unnamed protein product [Pedinophyceae sp. YPF-701]|nr:unnamed protein product [Pedinophyceae sp. YPF-701]
MASLAAYSALSGPAPRRGWAQQPPAEARSSSRRPHCPPCRALIGRPGQDAAHDVSPEAAPENKREAAVGAAAAGVAAVLTATTASPAVAAGREARRLYDHDLARAKAKGETKASARRKTTHKPAARAKAKTHATRSHLETPAAPPATKPLTLAPQRAAQTSAVTEGSMRVSKWDVPETRAAKGTATLPGMRPPAPPRRSVGGGVGAGAEWLGWTAAGAALLLVAWVSGGARVPAWLAGILGKTDGRRGGRWVRDRSLGGKIVWIEDRPARDGRGNGAVLGGMFSEEDEQEARRLRQRAAGSSMQAARPQAAPKKLPAWWVEPASFDPANSALDETGREEAHRKARAALRALEDGKSRGVDFSLPALLEIRYLVARAQRPVTPATPGGRDAIFRFLGDEAALAAAAGRRANIGGEDFADFITGAARDFNVPAETAARIATACIAKRHRSLLVQACAAVRARDIPLARDAAASLGRLVRGLPLEFGGAEGDLIAHGMRDSPNREREQVAELVEAAGLLEDSELLLVEWTLALRSAES